MQDSVWSKDGNPYVLEQNFTVPAGNTLKVKEGVVVQIPPDILFDVRGTLIASGTPSEPIFFTSMNDREGDGSSNGSSTPQARDWNRSITFSQRAAQGIFSHVIVRYGGGDYYCASGCVSQAMISVSRASLKVSDSTLSDTVEAIHGDDAAYIDIERTLFLNMAGGISASGSTVSVKDSSFVNVDEGIRNMWPYYNPYKAARNWWGSVRGPHKFPEDECGGSLVGRDTVFSPWLAARPDVGATSSPNLAEIPLSSDKGFVPVVVIPGILGSMEWNGKWLLDPILHSYDNLMNTLAANGYVASSTLFSLPYDWRRSNVETGQKLKALIDQIKSSEKCVRVDVVAHSMGGLAARSYIQSAEYSNDVRKLLFLGTPHKGAPEDYLAWESGEMPQTIVGRIISFLFRIYANIEGYSDGFSYIHGLPVSSIQELLPVYSYLHDNSQQSIGVNQFPVGYPRNPFLESLDESFGRAINRMNHRGSQIFNFLGNRASSTVIKIDVKKSTTTPAGSPWEHGKPAGLAYGSGDGTVPNESASIAAENIVVDAGHTEVPSEAAALVVKTLTGKDPIVIIHRSATRNLLTAAINKAASLAIITPTGKRVGRGIGDKVELTEAPGSFYSGLNTSPEYISIPDPEEGEYRMEVFGKEEGAYNVEISKSSESTSSTMVFSGVVKPDSVSVTNFSFDERADNSKVLYRPETLPIARTMSGKSRRRLPAPEKAVEAYVLMNISAAEFADMYMKNTLATDGIW